MADLELIELIHTTLLRYGKGTDDDPIRRIDQLWTKSGTLIAERDPLDARGWYEPLYRQEPVQP